MAEKNVSDIPRRNGVMYDLDNESIMSIIELIEELMYIPRSVRYDTCCIYVTCIYNKMMTEAELVISLLDTVHENECNIILIYCYANDLHSGVSLLLDRVPLAKKCASYNYYMAMSEMMLNTIRKAGVTFSTLRADKACFFVTRPPEIIKYIIEHDLVSEEIMKQVVRLTVSGTYYGVTINNMVKSLVSYYER